jgi:hypothetical protein
MNELEVLRIRDEVLQAMYWMRSEGIADAPSARELSRFLVVPHGTLVAYLQRFVSDGYLEPVGEGFALTAVGLETGKRTFAEEFADLTRPTHGECDEDCWCHESPEDAARCLEERTGHVVQH